MAPPTRWQRWTGATTYPLVWIAVYLLWLGFLGVLLFRLLPIDGWTASLAAFVVLAVLPFALIGVSNRMLRAYDPGGSE